MHFPNICKHFHTSLIACCSVAASPMHTTCGCCPSGGASTMVNTYELVPKQGANLLMYFFLSPFRCGCFMLFLWYLLETRRSHSHFSERTSLTMLCQSFAYQIGGNRCNRPYLCITLSSTKMFFMFCPILQPSCILLPLGMPTIELFQACGHVNTLCFHIWISIWHLKGARLERPDQVMMNLQSY